MICMFTHDGFSDQLVCVISHRCDGDVSIAVKVVTLFGMFGSLTERGLDVLRRISLICGKFGIR